MRLNILYRGPLSSCNYDCPYCPFAKHAESSEELLKDKQALSRFLDWVEQHSEFEIGVLFTPWGEALIRRWYQEALTRLTNCAHVWRAAIQTNLSCSLRWLDDCDKDKLSLWVTYHPGEVSRERFLDKCYHLDERGIRYSVGVVGLKEHAEEIEALREQLSPSVYMWINALKREANYYSEADIERWQQLDSLFPLNTVHYSSLGKACRAGESVISVDGDGTIRRCHFIKASLGNLYEDNIINILQPRPCTTITCGCHIGYVHMNDLNLYEVFGEGILERIPHSYGEHS